MIDKIRSFSNLKFGWDGYKAISPSPTAIATAICLYRTLDIKPDRIAPSVVGGIGFSFKDIYIEMYNDGQIYSVFRYDGEDSIISEETDMKELNKKINDYSRRKTS